VVGVAAPASHGEAVRPSHGGHDAHNGVISMYLVQELASERSRSRMDEAEQLRDSRRVRMLRRARRMERRAERRMIAAWRRAAELRDAVELAQH